MPACRSLGAGREKTKRGAIIDRAKVEVNGFSEMFSRLEQKIVLGGLSTSTLYNDGRCTLPRSACILIE
jgi:hypothetical protein